jgi:hypothetical protein
MSYKNFTLEQIEEQFQIPIYNNENLFENVLRKDEKQVDLHPAFKKYLEYGVNLALAINTEKARSEMIIAPILMEIRRLSQDQVSLFSGIEFNVNSNQGLTGFCDFIISASSQQLYIHAPVLIVFEAKNENIKEGLGQCLAAMISAHEFNQKKQNAIATIYGAVTTGNQWKFLKFENQIASIDTADYYIDRLETIMKILLYIIELSLNLSPALTP